MGTAAKNILICGLDKPNVLGTFSALAFKKLGHDVDYLDHSVTTVPVFGWKLDEGRVQERFLNKVESIDPDITLIIGGSQFDSHTLVQAAERSQTTLCNWNPDNPYMVRSVKRRDEAYLSTLHAYDYVFTWSPELRSRLLKDGATEVHHLPFGYDPMTHRPVHDNDTPSRDIIFIGHWSDKRQRYLSALVDMDAKVSIYGNYWRRKCWNLRLRRAVEGSAIQGPAYSAKLCSSKIALNIVADHNLDDYNMRSFEIPATGTFMLTSYTSGQTDIFGEGEGIACFRSPDELRSKAKQYLNDTPRRTEIANMGNQIVQDHSYQNRINRFLSIVS